MKKLIKVPLIMNNNVLESYVPHSIDFNK